MKNDTQNHDEYQYPKEEYSEHPASETPNEHSAENPAENADVPPPKKSNFISVAIDFLKTQFQTRPRVMFTLVAILALIIFFRIVHHTATTPSLDSNTIPTISPAATPAPATVAAPAPSSDFGFDLKKSSKETKDVSELKKNLSESQNTVADLQMKVHSLEESLATMASSQENINDELLALENQVSQLKADLTAKKTAKKKVIPTVPLVYTLRAAVPGRAWLQGSNNSTISVAVGDPVPQYGKVTQIFPERGMITTSSGKTIQFGNNT